MLLKKFTTILGYVSGFMIFLTGVIMLYDVFARYFLGSPSVWAQSISQYLILAAAFFGTSYCLQSGGHVHVEILVDRVRPLPRRILFTLGYLFALIFAAALLKSCWEYAVMAYQFAWDAQGNLPLPSVILYGIMVFGSVMLILTLLARVVEIWRKGDEKEAEK
jgi:TRAP-type C4-dicarboxylate transport system permease small subunit